MSEHDSTDAGVSGMSLYLPHPRVSLGAWCEWTGNPRDKIEAVVGTGFRCPDTDEDTYTMAATAVLRLIRQYDIDPSRVGFLGLGTESSKDNSAGAVILRGMLDRALRSLGLPELARDCEVPEFKHACLGGVYALKNGVRCVRTAGDERMAIAVAADIAEYRRGSSGEQTQGAGAVAMLIEREARLFEVPLENCASASQYRGPDFRKPFRRHLLDGSTGAGRETLHDYPVFSGRYSTFAYLDESLAAVRAMARRNGSTVAGALESVDAVFFHRPYHHMPLQGLAYLWLDAMAGTGDPVLDEVCAAAGVASHQVAAELAAAPDLFDQLCADGEPRDLYPAATAAAAKLRRSDGFRAYVAERMSLGTETAREFGNLYSPSLPAWLAAGLEQALADGRDLGGARLLAVGYGSGDAAEAMPLRVVAGWESAARRIDLATAMAGAIDLTRAQYEALHDGDTTRPFERPRRDTFAIAGVGDTHDADFQDLGVDYYEFVPPGAEDVAVDTGATRAASVRVSASG